MITQADADAFRARADGRVVFSLIRAADRPAPWAWWLAGAPDVRCAACNAPIDAKTFALFIISTLGDADAGLMFKFCPECVATPDRARRYGLIAAQQIFPDLRELHIHDAGHG